MNEEKELPEGWCWATFNDLILLSQNGCSKRRSDQGMPTVVLRLVDISDGRISLTNTRKIDLSDDEIESYKLLEDDLLCIRVNGSRNLVGRIMRFRPLNREIIAFCDHFIRFRLVVPKSAAFLSLYFETEMARRHIDTHMVSTAGQNTVSQGTITSVALPVPPLREQQRIVSAIEEHFTILDAVTTALQKNKQKLKLAHASVLKHAVEGKLTEKWRAEHPATESGSVLLERILTERRAKWEAEQLAKGKDPRKLRYEEPAEPDVSGLSELPEGWRWATVAQVSYFVRYGTSAKTSEDPSGVPVLRMGNVQDGQLDISNLKYLPVDHPEFPDLLLQDSDLLFNRTNSAELVGKSAVYRGKFEQCSYASYLICVRTVTECLTDYVCFFLNSLYGKAWVASVVTQQVGQANVNGTKLQNLVFPLPSFAEQQQIVAEVERRLSVIEQAEVAIETSLKRIGRARQSILERAFSGQLVPQDPHNEPASVLLERIQEERTRRVAEGKQRGKNGGVKAMRGKKTREQDFVPQWQLLRDAKQSRSVDGPLGSASVDEDGAVEKSEKALGDLVQMPLLSLWD